MYRQLASSDFVVVLEIGFLQTEKKEKFLSSLFCIVIKKSLPDKIETETCGLFN